MLSEINDFMEQNLALPIGIKELLVCCNLTKEI